MNGFQLLIQLQKMSNLQLSEEIRLIDSFGDDDAPNIWLEKVEVNVKGDVGFEVGGEIRLLGNE